MREILLAGEKAQERPPLERHVVADGASKHGILVFKRIKHRPLCNRWRDLDLHFGPHLRKTPKMERKFDPDHFNVCTSTESTAGRQRTMGASLAPESVQT